jgi:hypothetical protein
LKWVKKAFSMYTYESEGADFMAKAYAPGHITGFFQIHEHENPHRKGSTGCGIVLNGGVTTEVKVGRSVEKTEIFLNGKKVEGRTTRTVAEMMIEAGLDTGPSPVVVALENTAQVHHMVVCTLCSCYPKSLLGPPPDWYKSLPYRSRAASDPRGVLDEFDHAFGNDVEVRVVDSTANVRYLVVPRRPEGTASLGEEELASIVTRDSMIGVALPVAPV